MVPRRLWTRSAPRISTAIVMMEAPGRCRARRPLSPLSTIQCSMHGGFPHEWDRVIDAIDPPALLLVIEGRMSAAMRSRFTPEDIWQEALLHAWRDRGRYEWRGVKAFRNLLLTIIDHRIHEAADYLAAQKRGGKPERVFSALSAAGDGSFGPDVPRSTTPSRIAVQREQAEAIRSALNDLPDDLREVVRLRLIEQLPIEEIAARLQLGPSAVRHRFRKGAEIYAARLRQRLGSQTASAIQHSAPPGAPETSPKS